MSQAGEANFNIDQGSTFRLDVELKDADGLAVDISTAVIQSQIRKTASNYNLEASFIVEPIDLVNGKFALILTSEMTSDLKCNPSYSAYRTITQFAYDVEIHYSNGTVDRLLNGVLNVSPEVTR